MSVWCVKLAYRFAHCCNMRGLLPHLLLCQIRVTCDFDLSFSVQARCVTQWLLRLPRSSDSLLPLRTTKFFVSVQWIAGVFNEFKGCLIL